MMQKNLIIKFWLALLISTLSFAATQDIPETSTGLTKKIPPESPQLLYGGRWDKSNPAEYRCSWSGCAVTIRFKGSAIAAELSMGNNVRWQADIDGKKVAIIKNQSGKKLYMLASGLAKGEHVCTLVKRTEPHCWIGSFKGFMLPPDSDVLPKKDYSYSLHIIGDSISCGYGNEATSQNEHFTADTENGWAAYGALAAQYFNSNYVCTAWSGYKMWPDKLLPEVYPYTIPTDKNKKEWDFSSPAGAIVINLATNDFSRGNPEKEAWIKAYRDFIKVVRDKNPDAMIYCAIPPMLSDKWSKSKNARSTCKKYIEQVVSECNENGDKQIKLIEFPMQDGKLGMGADWHPSLKTHQQMADILIKTLETDLNWKKAARE